MSLNVVKTRPNEAITERSQTTNRMAVHQMTNQMKKRSEEGSSSDESDDEGSEEQSDDEHSESTTVRLKGLALMYRTSEVTTSQKTK
jgi:hypothetical protein